MAIEIYFSGLICHTGDSSDATGDRTTKTRAILVSDEEHTAYVTIKAGNKMTTITEPTSIVFGASDYGARADDQAFGRCVPHLSDLSATDVKLVFGNGLDIKVPIGAFYVASLFDSGAIYTLNGETTSKACVAQFTLLRADDDTIDLSVATDSGGTDNYTLSEGDWVLIENASDSEIVATGDHWAKFAKLLGGSHKLAKYSTNGPKLGCPPLIAGDHFDKAEAASNDKKPRAAGSSECSNSQWP